MAIDEKMLEETARLLGQKTIAKYSLPPDTRNSLYYNSKEDVYVSRLKLVENISIDVLFTVKDGHFSESRQSYVPFVSRVLISFKQDALTESEAFVTALALVRSQFM